MNPLFSIITITFNAQNELQPTLDSVKAQTFTDYEYLVIDGASKDNTVVMAREANIPNTTIISEPDKGLYDAMNKGVRKAKGEYLIFLNAGDSFAANNILELIAETAKSTDADIIYGNTDLVNDERVKLGARHLSPPAELTFKSFSNGMLVCHQAFVAKRSIVGEYDMQYRFSADYKWCIECLLKSKNNQYIPTTFIDYLVEGITDKNRYKSLRERLSIMCHYYGTMPTIIKHIGFIPRFLKSKR